MGILLELYAMKQCIFCGSDISHLPPKSKFCNSSHRVYHHRGLSFDGDLSPKKRGRKPNSQKPKEITHIDTPITTIVEEAKSGPWYRLDAAYAAHPLFPFDFENDNGMVRVDKYTQYPLNKRPAVAIHRPAFDKAKKESDNLIRMAWDDYKINLK